MQEAYKRVAVESDGIKSIDGSEPLDASTLSSNAETQEMQSSGQSGALSMHLPHILHRTVGSDGSQTEQDMQMSRHTINSTITDLNAASSMVDQSNVSQTIISETSASGTCNLATFLIQRACRNPTLSNYLYWYLCIECESHDTVRQQDEKTKHMYDTVLKTFKRTLMSTPELKVIKTNLEKQQVFIDELVKLVKCVAKESGNRKRKCEKFQQLLADSDAFRINFSNFEAIPLLLDPDIKIRGIVPMKVSLFKSALMPSK